MFDPAAIAVDIRLRLVLVYITADKGWLGSGHIHVHIVSEGVLVHQRCEAQVTELNQSQL